MTLRKLSWLIFLALAAASSLPGAEITGKVRDASGDAATVVIDGDTAPAVGDSAEIYFKVPGADEEISVASGKVAAVEAKVVKIKIEKTTGTLEKDQLVRIKSGSTPTTAGASPTPAASPSPTSPSIIGDWVGDAGREGTISLSFKADGTLLWMVQDEKSTMATLAKYRLNPATKPQSIEAFDFEEGPLKGGRLYGSFELQSDGRLKLEFDDKESPKEFTKDAVVFSKATSPIVRPTATTGSSIAGDWVASIPGGPTISFSFKEDGSVMWMFEDEKNAQTAHGKYRIDPSTQPNRIELFDIEEPELRGELSDGIFELQSDGRLKLDFRKGPKAPPLKEFSKEALVFSKATSPIVRSNKPPPPTPPPPTPDEALVTEAIPLYERGDYAGAIGTLEKAIALNPKNSRAYFYRGLCFYSTKDWPRAGADLAKAMELDPSLKLEDMINSTKVVFPADELVKEGDKLYESEDYDRAIEVYTKAIALNPKNFWAFYGRGKCFFRKKDRPAGIADHEKVMALDPSMKKVLDSFKAEQDFREKVEREELTPTPTAEPTATPTRSKTKRKR